MMKRVIEKMKVGDLKFIYTDQNKMVIISTISRIIHFWRYSLVLKIYAVLLMKMTVMIIHKKVKKILDVSLNIILIIESIHSYARDII